MFRAPVGIRHCRHVFWRSACEVVRLRVSRSYAPTAPCYGLHVQRPRSATRHIRSGNGLSDARESSTKVAVMDDPGDFRHRRRERLLAGEPAAARFPAGVEIFRCPAGISCSDGPAPATRAAQAASRRRGIDRQGTSGNSLGNGVGPRRSLRHGERGRAARGRTHRT